MFPPQVSSGGSEEDLHTVKTLINKAQKRNIPFHYHLLTIGSENQRIFLELLYVLEDFLGRSNLYTLHSEYLLTLAKYILLIACMYHVDIFVLLLYWQSYQQTYYMIHSQRQ